MNKFCPKKPFRCDECFELLPKFLKCFIKWHPWACAFLAEKKDRDNDKCKCPKKFKFDDYDDDDADDDEDWDD